VDNSVVILWHPI